MPSLDLYTVRIMTLITVLMSSLAIVLAWRTNRAVRGMPLFAMGFLSMSAGAIAGLTGAYTETTLAVALGALFRFGGIAMVGQSVRMFRGLRTWSPGALVALAATLAVLFTYWLHVQEIAGLRVGVLALSNAIIAADAAAVMFRDVPRADRLAYWSTGAVFAFVAVFMTLRAGFNISGAARVAAFSTTPVEIPATICSNVAFVGCAFGMLLASNSRLRHLAEMNALYDPLTSLPNRRLFQDRLVDAERRARESGASLGVIYLDLDDFKLINDTQGHQVGDELLRLVSRVMSKILRTSDCLARVGGDEFVILAEKVEGRSQLRTLAERVSAAIEKEHEVDGLTLTTRASWGVALFPEDGISAHDVMREADTEMYRTKRARRKAIEDAQVQS